MRATGKPMRLKNIKRECRLSMCRMGYEVRSASSHTPTRAPSDRIYFAPHADFS